MPSLISSIGNERLEILSTDDFLVINALFHDQKLSNNLRSRTNRLIDMGIIEHAGRGKYILARRLYEATGKPGIHTRLKGLDRETNKELLLKHISGNEDKGTPFKELHHVLPGHSRRQIQILLIELRNESRVYVTGNTSSAKWFAGTKQV